MDILEKKTFYSVHLKDGSSFYVCCDLQFIEYIKNNSDLITLYKEESNILNEYIKEHNKLINNINSFFN